MVTDANAGEGVLVRSLPVSGERPRLLHVSGLDGIRAVAVLGLIAFHTGLSSVPGGFYGVDAFFVLSGYLITSLLLTEWGSTGRINLGRFWAARARRLLPALFVLVAVIGIVMAVVPRLLATPHILGDALSTIFYASNWYSIHGGANYFSTATQLSPLLHTWSLAIEEQFYLVWPLVVLGVLKLGGQARRRSQHHSRIWTVRVVGGAHLVMFPRVADPDPEWIRRRRLHLLFGLAAFGALASALEMVWLAPGGYTTRAYYGTDTRAQALLVGAALATGLTLWKTQSEVPWFRQLCGVLGLVGLAGSALMWATANENTTFAFSGGFLLASLAAALVVLGAVVTPKGPAVRLLEIPPLPALGRISYGVYLWYWPVLLVMSGSRLHWGVYPLFLARVTVTVTIAALSAHFIELPIRRRTSLNWRTLVAAPVAAAGAVGLVFISTLVPVGAAALQGSSVLVRPIKNLVPATLSPALPTTTTTSTTTTASARPIKVLLLGDSIAGTLGVGLSQYEASDNVQIVNEGIPGCSVSMDQQIRVLFYTLPPGKPCGAGNPAPLFAQWQKWIDQYNPDVVVYVARGETFDQEEGGQWVHLGQAAFDQFVEDRYRQAINVLGSKGATVVLMTSPYYDSGTSPAGTIWPEDAPGRVVIDNELIRQAVDQANTNTSSGNPVYVFNLNAIVSTHDQFAPSFDGVSMRCVDGVHFTPAGGEFVGLQLLPDLVQLGQVHHNSSPDGSWAGRLPPTTPPWYPKLPC